MTPKQKAKQLIDNMYMEMSDFMITDKVLEVVAKQCALIAVDEVIECCNEYDEVHENYTTQVDYWKQVKNEIEQL